MATLKLKPPNARPGGADDTPSAPARRDRPPLRGGAGGRPRPTLASAQADRAAPAEQPGGADHRPPRPDPRRGATGAMGATGASGPAAPGRNSRPPRDPWRDTAPAEPQRGTGPAEPVRGSGPNEPQHATRPNEPQRGTRPNEPQRGIGPNESQRGTWPKEPQRGTRPNEPQRATRPNEPHRGIGPNKPQRGSRPKEPQRGSGPAEPWRGSVGAEPWRGSGTAESRRGSGPAESRRGSGPGEPRRDSAGGAPPHGAQQRGGGGDGASRADAAGRPPRAAAAPASPPPRRRQPPRTQPHEPAPPGPPPRRAPSRTQPASAPRHGPHPNHEHDDDDDDAAARAHAEIPGSLRLSKRMSQLGIASRREADEWIARGWVRVDDHVVSQLGSRVLPEQRITIDARAKFQQAQKVTVLLNKPVGWVSGQAEDGYEPAVVLVTPQNQWQRDRSGTRFLREHLKNLVPAGRLDIDSVGLLVLTQDGRVAKQLVGEDGDVEKEYLVRVATVAGQPLPVDGLRRLRHGIELDGEPLREAQVEWVNDDQLRFVLKEGRKRQIRRMCEAVGLRVLGLKRVRIGPVALGELPVGQWRYLRADESFG